MYDKDAPPRPDWRITCFYVDKKHRGEGIARQALEGALDQIARADGGLVEAISEVTAGRDAPGRPDRGLAGVSHGRDERALRGNMVLAT
jgi:GNAT superfamily N-acetyltransferase